MYKVGDILLQNFKMQVKHLKGLKQSENTKTKIKELIKIINELEK